MSASPLGNTNLILKMIEPQVWQHINQYLATHFILGNKEITAKTVKRRGDGHQLEVGSVAELSTKPIVGDNVDIRSNAQYLAVDNETVTAHMASQSVELQGIPAYDIKLRYNRIPLAVQRLKNSIERFQEEVILNEIAGQSASTIWGTAPVEADSLHYNKAASSITSSDTLSVASIQAAKDAIRELGDTEGYIQPLTIDKTNRGGDNYLLIIHPVAFKQLRQDSDYETAVSYAFPRGTSNPWFTGQIPIIDGCPIRVSRYVPVVDDKGASNEDVVYNVIIGRGAVRYIDVELPNGLLYTQEDQAGGVLYLVMRRMFGIKKLMFDAGDGTVRNAGVYNLFTYHSA